MITIWLNGAEKKIEPQTLKNFLIDLQISNRNFAVAVNEEIIPKSQIEGTQLREGDTVELITAVGGG